MLAIVKRELSSYFHSLIGYVYLAVFFGFSGFYFFATSLYSNTTSLNYMYNGLFVIICFLIPILTMKLFSVERKQKTDQALLTAPVSLFSIVMGKYLSVLLIYLFSISITLLYGIIISFFAPAEWAVILGNFVALFLIGASIISIDMFISSTTESQSIAAVASFAVSFLVIMFDAITNLVSVDFISKILKGVSLTQHYYNTFTIGIFNIADIIFFLSICTLFVFFTIRVFEKRRWS